MNYETVIGLEVHVHLKTASKMFCGCSTKFGSPPNTQVCPICLGFPGVLPVINNKAFSLGIKTALALNCRIAEFTKFDRKHYFYPDLPKNFQISQYDKPFSHDGFLDIETAEAVKKIRLKRIHLEEDAGKLVHKEEDDYSLVDYNRAGIPLLEIVTEPDIGSPSEAYEFLVKLKNILEYLEVSNCNMEEGSLRCDANISVRPIGQSELGTKIELKNMNSFKAVRQGLEYEAERQTAVLKEGKKIEFQETRLWDSEQLVTYTMRSKEEAHDYRYFPEPDLPPVVPNAALIEEIRKTLPEMPKQRRERFIRDYALSGYDAQILTKEKKLADFFEACLKIFNKPKIVANWLMSDIAAALGSKGMSIGEVSFKPQDLAEILGMIESGAISGKMAKELLKESIDTGKRPAEIAKVKGLSQISDKSAISAALEKVLSMNQKAVSDYKTGKGTALTFLVGQVMKETKGKANPALVNELLKKRMGGA
ncbi:MAG: Asp-tRNA(Asn)/Glu-tRNA(Gln) amidotransferase subunit GatB [Candidatus Omnitrophica bacterium]|nr:Asp-tRNA(Asn)/Glu-tRNA(Gln) amidotransferase subunit GatB [Candidatus Omnitrophota bacterium]